MRRTNNAVTRLPGGSGKHDQGSCYPVRHDGQDALYKVFDVYFLTTRATERSYTEHVHPQFEISVITSVSGLHTCSGVDYNFSTGDVCMHCGNDIHHFMRVDPGGQRSLLVFQFEPRLAMSRSKRSVLRHIEILPTA